MRRIVLKRLLGFIILFILGNLFMGLFILPYLFFADYSLVDLMEGFDFTSIGDLHFIRYLLLGQALCLFIIPSIIYGKYFFKRKLGLVFDLQASPRYFLAGLAILFLLASYPLVNLAFLINQSLPLSEWMPEMEQQAAHLLDQLLQMDGPLDYLYSLVLIALLPAIGEELVFRGILQKQLQHILHPLLALWIAAIIFSGFHFQFEGFFPRLVLGAVLGYVYYWTGNLWYPIILHFVNNGIQITALYFLGADLSEMPGENTKMITPLTLLLGICIMYLCYEGIRKLVRNKMPPPLPVENREPDQHSI